MIKDAIHLKNIESFCRLGIYEEERQRGQTIIVDLELEFDLSIPGKSNDIEDTINYVDVSRLVQATAQAKEYWLVEHLTAEIIKALLKQFTKLDAIKALVYKPVIKADGFSGNVSISVYRTRAAMENNEF